LDADSSVENIMRYFPDDFAAHIAIYSAIFAKNWSRGAMGFGKPDG